MIAGQQAPALVGVATCLPDMDFETYSEADLPQVGAAVYAEDPTTEVLCLAYDLKDNLGPRLWVPGCPSPQELFNHIAAGGLIEAHNSSFEYWIWQKVCHDRLGWPELPLEQLRDSMAKAQLFSLPASLAKAGPAVGAQILKDSQGKRLINKFSKPRKPTKADPKLRLTPLEDPEDGQLLYNYCITDIQTEADLSSRVPDLSPIELELWLEDQRINRRGVAIDTEALKGCINIIEQAEAKYNAELEQLTQGAVCKATEVPSIKNYLAARGLKVSGLDKEKVEKLLNRYEEVYALLQDGVPIPPALRIYQDTPDCKRVLEIRAALGATSVQKVYAMDRMLAKDNRLHNMFMYSGASHTGRWAGRGPQPHNLPNSGPRVKKCTPVLGGCGEHYGLGHEVCPWCGVPDTNNIEVDWSIEAAESALVAICTGSLAVLEYYYGDALAAISGSLRALFIAGPGMDLLCSDYSAIEAVVLAALAGEEWRLEVFRSHGLIYEASAAKITGVPFQEFIDHKAEHGEHHPLRKKIGKVAELASGYQGSVGAWKAFGADKYFNEDEDILKAVKKWREESPNIVSFWYAVEDAAKQAISYPGQLYEVRGISFQVSNNILCVRLLSGRYLYYHSPLLYSGEYGRQSITYMGAHKGGWVRLDTYGGKLVENIVQATARDLLAHSLVGLSKAGYPAVLHVHDEIVAEVPEGSGSIEELENIMANTPPWAQGWPVKAAGGWRGKRYRKD
jgi:DNA polymerase